MALPGRAELAVDADRRTPGRRRLRAAARHLPAGAAGGPQLHGEALTRRAGGRQHAAGPDPERRARRRAVAPKAQSHALFTKLMGRANTSHSYRALQPAYNAIGALE